MQESKFSAAFQAKKKRKVVYRRKRTLDPNTLIDYKKPDSLKRFITDRGKIIPRRISGATSDQQRQICLAVKRARYLSLLPYSVAHREEKGLAGLLTHAFYASSRNARFEASRSREGGPGFSAGRDDQGDREKPIDTESDTNSNQEGK